MRTILIKRLREITIYIYGCKLFRFSEKVKSTYECITVRGSSPKLHTYPPYLILIMYTGLCICHHHHTCVLTAFRHSAHRRATLFLARDPYEGTWYTHHTHTLRSVYCIAP